MITACLSEGVKMKKKYIIEIEDEIPIVKEIVEPCTTEESMTIEKACEMAKKINDKLIYKLDNKMKEARSYAHQLDWMSRNIQERK